MHSIELMEQAIAAAKALGYGVRQEYLGGVGGGGCEIAGRKWLFLDLALSTEEQLGQVIETLLLDHGIYTLELSPELARRMGIRRAA